MPGRPRVVTLTLNPAIDVSSEAETVRHTHKVRTSKESMEAGGGGINVARVLKKLGVDVTALFLGGGATGRVLDDLLARGGIDRRMVEIADDTRLSLTVLELSTGNEYRFVPEGPEVSEAEVAAAIDGAASLDCDYFVASGSLPRGVTEGFYAQLFERIRSRGARFVLDTSGDALEAALEAGGIFLVKPSRGEFERLVGRKLTDDELAREAKVLVECGKADNVAITLGRDGALLASREGAVFRKALEVDACSAVGAGDSFVAGMVFGFALGRGPGEALDFGLATGAAAAMSCGSELARVEDLKRLLAPLLSGEEVDHFGFGSDCLEQ